jgi:vacuolar-type H+-ATPase subunit H
VPDDTLQRTLLLAQKFVDETKADSEAQAARVVAEAEAKARHLTEQAQSQASQLAAESEQRLREEIARLEDARGRLSHEVETMNRHLEGERSRLRTALSEILRWVDENVQPGASAESARPGSDAGAPGTPGSAAQPAPAHAAMGGNRPAAAPQDPSGPGNSGTGPSGAVGQMRPAGAANAPAGSNAPLAH